MSFKKNPSLYVALAIPILMVVFVLASVYIPRMFIHPTVDFVYVTGGDYYMSQEFDIVDSSITVNKSARPMSVPESLRKPHIYRYDALLKKSSEISLAEAQKLKFDSNPKSSDGFTVEYGAVSEGVFPIFFYSGRDYSTRYIAGHGVSFKIDISNDSYNYNNFKFLGWVIQ